MENCIFCKIAEGTLPASKVFENKHVLAFLDIGPVNKGHALVIPKKHHETLFDVPDDLMKELAVAVKKTAEAVKKAVEADGISIGQSNHSAAGQVVPHTHFHIIPRFKADGLKLWPQGTYDDNDEMQKYAGLIRAELKQ